MQLENEESKEQIINDFFIWLFSDEDSLVENANLEKEVDLTLTPFYKDPNIYYPSCIAKLIETSAFKRLGRISQLSTILDTFPNTYHNRLEHCKGTYNRKLEEFIYKYQDESWRDSIETNHQKIYVLADLIKMLGHDIGHPILSHAMEDAIFSKHGAHEIIGKRIMTELPVIQDILQSINPRLPNALKEVYEKNILNFEDHDDSNYDVDRLDFIPRDSLYIGIPIHLPFQNYKTVSTSNGLIDVYYNSSLKHIEKVFNLRIFNYKKIYISIERMLRESVLGYFIDAFLSCDSECGKDLKQFLITLKNTDINNLDLNEFIEWDEIRFYDNLMEIAQFHENEHIQDMATMLIPNITAFLSLLYSHLDVKNTKQYSPSDKVFLKKIKTFITEANSELLEKLSSDSYANNNILIAKDSSHHADANNLSFSIIPYKKSKPIYIHHDKTGIIYELSHHPERARNWDTDIISASIDYLIIPYLRFKGLSDEEISQKFNCFETLSEYTSHEKVPKPQVNMQPLQVGHDIRDVFHDIRDVFLEL